FISAKGPTHGWHGDRVTNREIVQRHPAARSEEWMMARYFDLAPARRAHVEDRLHAAINPVRDLRCTHPAILREAIDRGELAAHAFFDCQPRTGHRVIYECMGYEAFTNRGSGCQYDQIRLL